MVFILNCNNNAYLVFIDCIEYCYCQENILYTISI